MNFSPPAVNRGGERGVYCKFSTQKSGLVGCYQQIYTPLYSNGCQRAVDWQRAEIGLRYGDFSMSNYMTHRSSSSSISNHLDLMNHSRAAAAVAVRKIGGLSVYSGRSRGFRNNGVSIA